MKTSRGLLLALPLVACGARPLPGESGSDGETMSGTTGTSSGSSGVTTTTMGTPTTGGHGGTTGEVDTATASSSADATSAPFIHPPDATAHDDCDAWDPNSCPKGQKCTFDGAFSDTHCVEIVDEPKDMYEPCQVLMGDVMSGFDDCGAGLFCWSVDPDTGIGECVGLCVGSPDAPGCVDPAASCTLCQECVTGLCLPGCDPLLQDCSDTEVCIENMGQFLCVLDASGEEGQVFDPCEYANGCDKGLVCVDPKLAQECDPMFIGCCLPFCDTTMPVCPGVNQECLPWFEMGMAPPGYENVGLCGVPQP